MAPSQPLLVKFHATLALEKILNNNAPAKQYIKSGLGIMVKCYLTLMEDFDNELLIAAF